MLVFKIIISPYFFLLSILKVERLNFITDQPTILFIIVFEKLLNKWKIKPNIGCRMNLASAAIKHIWLNIYQYYNVGRSMLYGGSHDSHIINY